MPYNSETSQYERRATTVIDATPDGDTVAVAIDVKLDQGIDDYVTDLNHHAANGRHYPATSVASDSRFLKQSPAGEVSWADGVAAADAALKDFSNVAAGAIASDKLASVAPAKITQDASNRFMTDAERTKLSGIEAGAQVNSAITKAEIETVLTGEVSSHSHAVPNVVKTGTVVFFAANAAPTGYIKANGAEISRSTYAALFGVVGTVFGAGNGSTTFNVPDLRGEFMRGWDDARGVDGGRVFGSAQADGFKSHNHTLEAATDESDIGPKVRGGGTLATTGTSETSYVGGTETRPRNIALLACIKY